MRIFYSHTFVPQHSAKVAVFRELLDRAGRGIEHRAKDAEGNVQVSVEVVEGNQASFDDPAHAVFPLIESCDVLVALLLDETGPSRAGFVSPACLQEIVVARRAGKNVLVWVERGCQAHLGFVPSLTTYGEFDVDDLILATGRDRIAGNLEDRLLGLVESPAPAGGACLYLNTFDEPSSDRIANFEWRRAYLEPDGRTARVQEAPRPGGQTLLRFGGEHGGGCLLVAHTRDTWNWSLEAGKSITTLARLSGRDFSRGQEMRFEARCRSSSRVRLRPLFNGPAVDPVAPDDRGKQDWELVDPAHSPDWAYKSVVAEDGWTTRIFCCQIDYREGYVIRAPVTLYLVADTAQDVLFIDRVSLTIDKARSVPQ
jgi:hypothetical protein